jgi:hypothetical protein
MRQHSLRQIAERHSFLYLTWERRVLPESGGNDIYKDSDDYLFWVQKELHRFVEERCPYLEVNTGRCRLKPRTLARLQDCAGF